MEKEPKLTDGWGLVDGDTHYGNHDYDAYDYRLIRRKKEEPMPEIRVGDAMWVDDEYALGAAEVVIVIGLVPDLLISTIKGTTRFISTCRIRDITRNNKIIWERKS